MFLLDYNIRQFNVAKKKKSNLHLDSKHRTAFENIENKGLDMFDRLKNYNIILNINLYANQHVRADVVVHDNALGKYATI